MIAGLGVVARWTHLAACVGLVGGAAILLLAGPSDRLTARRWSAQVISWARITAVVAIVSGIATLAWQAALLAGRGQAALDPAMLARVALETQAGRVWLVRHGLLLLLLAFLLMRADLRDRLDWLAARGETVLLAFIALSLLSLAGHAAAAEADAGLAIASDVVHLAATGLWIGGLLPLATLLRSASAPAGADARPYAAVAIRRFSRWAPLAVVALALTGMVSASINVGDVAGLVGTPYGRLLLLKLALLVPILVLAWLNRRSLPALSGDSETVGRPAMRRLARFVSGEAALALGLLVVVATMNGTPPARHEQPTWPFGFRLTTAALEEAPALRVRALVGSQVALLGAVAVICSVLLRRLRAPLLAGAAVLLAAGAALALPPLAVDAYPATYRRPAVAYTAASIASGMTFYAEHCARCHGRDGGGDGPGGRGLPRRPADLRAPHTGQHTAGDLFWWISHGIPAAAMPSFADRLDESARWDLVNLVRALGAAAEARRLGAIVEPERPRIVAPDASFAVGPTPSRSLKEHRGRRLVLLVLYTLPGSRDRLAQLARDYPQLVGLGAEMIAVPRDADPDAIRRLGADPVVLFPVVTDGAADVERAYGLFSPAPHAEFLIDRQGYLRAVVAGEWSPPGALRAAVQQLNAEKVVAPIAAEHVH